MINFFNPTYQTKIKIIPFNTCSTNISTTNTNSSLFFFSLVAKDTNVKYEMMRVVTRHPSSISSYIPILMMQGKEGRNSISPRPLIILI